MSWEEIDADRHGSGAPRTYYAVMTREDYSIQPDALFSSEKEANGWVAWQRGLWTEEEEEGIHPSAEICVLAVRNLQGRAWNSYEPIKDLL